MCYMTRQLLPSPSEGALIRAGGRWSRALRSPFGQPSGARGAVRRGWRPTPAPSERSSCLPRGTESCVFGYPIETRRPHSASERGRGWRKAAAGLFAHGCGCEGAGSGMFCWRSSSVRFLIPPHHLKERVRNFNTNKTCSVFHRTSA